MEDIEMENVIAAINVINDTTIDMWSVAIGLTALEIAMLCYALAERSITFGQSGSAKALFVAGLLSSISIMFGFGAKLGTTSLVVDIAFGGKVREFPQTIEWMNALQAIFLLLGIIFFLIIFWYYSRELAKILVKMRGK